MISPQKFQWIDAYLKGHLSTEQQAQVEQWMDDYLSGKLSPKDQALFDHKLQQDNAFAREIELHRDIRLSLEKALDEEFQEEVLNQDLLASIDQDKNNELKTRFVLLEEQLVEKQCASAGSLQPKIENHTCFYWLSGLAACLLFGLLVYWFWQNQHKPEQLFAKYYEPYMIASVQRNSLAPNTQQQAMQAYEEENYKLAAKAFKSCLSLTPEEISCQFYLGLSYMETQQLPKAEEFLKQVIQATPNDYVTRAQWYLALLYLKSNKIEDAVAILKVLRKDQSFYGEKATELLKKL